MIYRGLRPVVLSGLLVAAACSDSGIAVDLDPPGPIRALTAVADGGRVRLSWVEPGDADVVGSLLARFPSTGVDAQPEARRAYAQGETMGSGQAVFAGRGTEASDNPPCREQIYAAWARDAAGNWSAAPQTARVAGLPMPAPPTGLAAVVDGTGIALSWTPPGNAPAALARVVRRRQSPPVDASDGETVFIGSAVSARDATPEISPLVTWHYAVFSCTPCGECEPAGARAAVTPTLMQSLRAGGFVIYWRHATATVCSDQQDLGFASMPKLVDWWKSCDPSCPPAGNATARQLSPQGYAEADAIGNALRSRQILFSRVLSSEYCRATETAARMALGPTAETLAEITFYVYPALDPCAALPTLFARAPTIGNTAIVAHLFVGCTDGLASGEALVYRPDGKGGSTFVARVLASEWAGLT